MNIDARNIDAKFQEAVEYIMRTRSEKTAIKAIRKAVIEYQSDKERIKLQSQTILDQSEQIREYECFLSELKRLQSTFT